MITYSATLKGIGGARTGIAPANLLEVETVDGDVYFWADRKIAVVPRIASPLLLQSTLKIGALCGAFTDSDGYVVEPVPIGDSATLVVPAGASQLLLGVNDDAYFDNTGSWQIDVSVNGGTAVAVTVPGTAMPWDPVLNPGYSFGADDGTAPVVGASGLSAGETVTVTYVSGTVSADGVHLTDANGYAGNETSARSMMVYATSNSNSADGTGGASSGDSSCSLSITAPYGAVTTADRGGAEAIWSNYQMPALYAGSEVTAILPIGTFDVQISQADFIPAVGINLPSGSFSGTYTGGNLGTNASAVTSFAPSCQLLYSLDGAIFTDTAKVTNFGLKIEYTANSGYPINYTLPNGFPAKYMGSSTLTANQDYDPWLLAVPSFAFHRSLQTDVGSFIVQNISGDTLSRDLEKLWRAEAFEGAFFVYRLWQPDAEAAWLEVHGTLTVEAGDSDTAQMKGMQLLNPAQDDTPLEIYCETCQLNWAGKRCGSTQTTECMYSYQSCQVLERIMVAMNNYEKNYGETTANTAQNVINRRRRI